MSYLFKDFLNFEEVGEYLSQYGYSYDLELEADYYRLKDTILDLYNEQKLSIVFYYNYLATIRTMQVAESGWTEQVEEFEFYISGYFHAPEATIILKEGADLRIISSYYSYYLLHNKDELPIYDNDDKYKNTIGNKFTSIELGDDIAPLIIEFNDIRYPKADLDKLFKPQTELTNSQPNYGSFFMGTPTVSQTEPRSDKEVIELLRQEIADLESQLAQAQSANTPADAVELKGLDKYNVKKAMAITTAKAIAKYIWSMDNSQAIRKGDMVQQIRHIMHNIEPELLPDDKAIRGWLSDIAPDYATKGGKPPKDAPNEIPPNHEKVISLNTEIPRLCQ